MATTYSVGSAHSGVINVVPVSGTVKVIPPRTTLTTAGGGTNMTRFVGSPDRGSSIIKDQKPNIVASPVRVSVTVPSKPVVTGFSPPPVTVGSSGAGVSGALAHSASSSTSVSTGAPSTIGGPAGEQKIQIMRSASGVTVCGLRPNQRLEGRGDGKFQLVNIPNEEEWHDGSPQFIAYAKVHENRKPQAAEPVMRPPVQYGQPAQESSANTAFMLRTLESALLQNPGNVDLQIRVRQLRQQMNDEYDPDGRPSGWYSGSATSYSYDEYDDQFGRPRRKNELSQRSIESKQRYERKRRTLNKLTRRAGDLRQEITKKRKLIEQALTKQVRNEIRAELGDAYRRTGSSHLDDDDYGGETLPGADAHQHGADYDDLDVPGSVRRPSPTRTMKFDTPASTFQPRHRVGQPSSKKTKSDKKKKKLKQSATVVPNITGCTTYVGGQALDAEGERTEATATSLLDDVDGVGGSHRARPADYNAEDGSEPEFDEQDEGEREGAASEPKSSGKSSSRKRKPSDRSLASPLLVKTSRTGRLVAPRSRFDEEQTSSKKGKPLKAEVDTKPTIDSLEADALLVAGSKRSKADVKLKKKKGPREKDQSTPTAIPSTKRKNKKEELFCICKTPFDKDKFYVGCDMCSNWFHGSCVGITEKLSRKMDSYICDDCKKQADDAQADVYCICKTPYDTDRFYIGCDDCDDWFHVECVGLSQAVAEKMDKYRCPSCAEQGDDEEESGEERVLDIVGDYPPLMKLVKQMKAHKMAWPFTDPVDPLQVPDYYRIIKSPMDLSTILRRFEQGNYLKLSGFVSDVHLMFNNCRHYNPPESQFVQCASVLESYFLHQLKPIKKKLLVSSL